MSFDDGLSQGLRNISQVLEDIQTRLELAAVRSMFPDVPNVEDAKTVEVGRVYFVNVVTTVKDSKWRGASFPVLGPLHDDSDFLFVEPDNAPHWHLDWRFFPSTVYADFVNKSLADFKQWTGYDPATSRNLQLAVVLSGLDVASEQRWPLPCQRNQLRWEVIPPWLANMEAAHKDKRVECNRCPHRGISLIGAPEDEHGNRICAGHGLRWSRDGRLVPRALLQTEKEKSA